MANWFHCDELTGAIITAGMSSEEDALKNEAPEGSRLIIVPDGMITNPFSEGPDFSRLRSHLGAMIDRQAGEFSSQFVTIAPTQDMRYQEKYTEALGWTNQTEPTDVPFLAAEAEETDSTIEEVRDLVLATRTQWKSIGSKIEGKRIGAKKKINNATNLITIVDAAKIDWDALIAS